MCRELSISAFLALHGPSAHLALSWNSLRSTMRTTQQFALQATQALMHKTNAVGGAGFFLRLTARDSFFPFIPPRMSPSDHVTISQYFLRQPVCNCDVIVPSHKSGARGHTISTATPNKPPCNFCFLVFFTSGF